MDDPIQFFRLAVKMNRRVIRWLLGIGAVVAAAFMYWVVFDAPAVGNRTAQLVMGVLLGPVPIVLGFAWTLRPHPAIRALEHPETLKTFWIVSFHQVKSLMVRTDQGRAYELPVLPGQLERGMELLLTIAPHIRPEDPNAP